MISRVVFWSTIFLISTLILIYCLFVADSYWALYLSMIFHLACSAKLKGITCRSLAIFLIVYLGIALLDISYYQGSIEIQTLQLYGKTTLLIFTGIYIAGLIRNKISRKYGYQGPLTQCQKVTILNSSRYCPHSG